MYTLGIYDTAGSIPDNKWMIVGGILYDEIWTWVWDRTGMIGSLIEKRIGTINKYPISIMIAFHTPPLP
jgi:hypothetical protein